MNRSSSRSVLVRIASLAVASVLAGCGGGSTLGPGGSSAGAGTVVPADSASAGFGLGLGLVPADDATIGALTHIRRTLSVTALPSAVDLSPKLPPVGNQGQENSCVAWASAYAMRGYEAREDVWSAIAPKSSDPTLNFSPAFVYNQLNGGRDGGSTIPGALALMQQKGAATLADMPYASGAFTQQPSAAAFADALHYRLSSYGYIAPSDLTSIKLQLADGLPVILAIKVYNNFYTLGANQVYSAVAGGYAGGHAVTAVGYDDSKQAVEIINSWGPTWGTAGYGWIGYSALNQIAIEAYSAIDDHGLPATAKATPAPTPTIKPTPAPAAKATPVAKQTPAAKPSPTATPKPSR